ncbi:putative phosphohydrolase [Candidatus Desulfosporosinus infrequens]|uniref:Putative phosphohydrolase n=1 Tax=Candidatus Desulfosporosinus infrequens TaxID=2043169 RepID=A0A2U3LWJ4_9FIRM|nr:putative phosphohydrolase [Candidatus Desulfosporosinus infrequens]
MPTRRAFLKCLAGLGAGSLLWGNAMLPKTAISLPSRADKDQRWIKNPEAKLTFVVVSDIHIARSGAIRNFSALLDDNENSKPDALIVVGDLGDGLPRDYTTLRNELAEYKMKINYPIYWTIGNHEYYGGFYKYGLWSPKTFPNGETEAIAIDRFLMLAKRDKVYGDAWINDYHFIFLGSEKSRMSDITNADLAFLSDAQLDWFQTVLTDNEQPHKPLFVFLHQPIAYYTLEGVQPSYVIQGQRLHDILLQHPEIIMFNGHTHYELDFRNNASDASFTMINSSSLANPMDTHRRPIIDSAPGLTVEVFSDKVIIKGRNFLGPNWISTAEITIPER